jgi:hypothetical protein
MADTRTVARCGARERGDVAAAGAEPQSQKIEEREQHLRSAIQLLAPRENGAPPSRHPIGILKIILRCLKLLLLEGSM